MFSRGRMQVPPLVRVFFARFFENEIAGGTGDVRATFFWLLSFLAAPGFLLPILIAFGWAGGSAPAAWATPENWGWSMVARHQGLEALRALSLTDKTLYLGFVMTATGGLAALVWTSLLPDRRDALVLGALPVRPATVVLARLAALTSYVAIVAVGMNLLASLSFGVLLAAGNTFEFAMSGIAAHFIASVGASLFVCAAIVAIQGLVLVVGGPRVFARVSPMLQTILVGLVAVGVMSLPLVSGAAGDAVRGAPVAQLWALWTPALWFLGLYEWVLGTDSPTLIGLARVAIASLGTAVALAAAIYPFAYWRLMAAGVERGEYSRPSGLAAVIRLLAAVTSRDAAVRALAEFFLTTIVRVDRHRFVMAASLGMAVAWTATGGAALSTGPPSLPRVDLLSLPFAAVVFVLAGIRITAAMPSTLPPAWVFEHAAPTAQQSRVALERTMALVVALPTALASAALVGWWWGGAAAIVHTAMVLAVSDVVIQTLVWRCATVPCTQPWDSGQLELRKWWPAYVAGFAVLTSGMAAIEWLLLTAIVAPNAVPLMPNLWLVVPVTLGAIVAVGRLVRTTALHSVASRDAGDLDVLTEAMRAGAGLSNNRDAREASSGLTYDDTDGPHRGRAASGILLGTPPATERDGWLDDFDVRPGEIARDLRMALRRLRHAPGFTAFAVLTLALGIGVTTAASSLVVALASRPMEIRDPDSVVTIRSRNQPFVRSLSWLDFQDLRVQQTTFSFVEAQSQFPASLSAGGITSLVSGQLVTGGFFELLGVQAAIGRTIQPADDRAEATPVVVLSESLWRTRFARDPSIVGRPVRIGGASYEVVGVVPRSFRGLDARAAQPAVWVPMAHPPLTDPSLTAHRDPAARGRGYLAVVARLRTPGSARAAEADVAAIADRLDRDAPIGPSRMWTIGPVAVSQWLRATQLYGAVAVLLPVLVLLIACTNLANLVLSNAAVRRHELAVRRALGASRWSLVRAQIVEHALLAATGTAGGIALAQVLITYVLSFVQRTLGYAPQYQVDAHIDPMALAIAAGAALLAVSVAGLAPAIQLTSDRPGRVLGNDAAATMSVRWLGRRRLLTGQVAASLALLLVAALCLRQAFAIAREERATGDLSGIGLVAVALPLRTHDEARVDEISDRILFEARRAGGLSAVAVSTGLHAAGAAGVETTTIDRPLLTARLEPSAALVAASREIFSVLGLRIVSGRPYGDEHTRSGERVAVISESESRALFGTVDAAGRELLLRRSGDAEIRTLRVLGVVTDAGRDPRTGAPFRDVYVPFAQRLGEDRRLPAPPLPILGRPATGGAAAAVSRLTTAVRRADADLAVSFGGAASTLSGGTSLIFGLVVQSTSALALFALALSMSGLYSVMSHLVASRRHEIGIRLALGADRRAILRLVFADGVRPVAVGLFVGLVAAAIVRMAMQPLFRTSSAAVDPVAVVIAIVPLVAAALVACYIPARRAATVDPSVTLRDL
jgi:putative ABC transport system permease protein